jgi:hypothetical protein
VGVGGLIWHGFLGWGFSRGGGGKVLFGIWRGDGGGGVARRGLHWRHAERGAAGGYGPFLIRVGMAAAARRLRSAARV